MPKNLLLALLLVACAAPAEDPISTFPSSANARVTLPSTSIEACSPDEGLVLGPDGAVDVGITQCALCRRFEDAYEARSRELGGCAPFPAEACVDEGLSDCLVELVDAWADFGWALDCEDLETYAAAPETYAGFVCGPDCAVTGRPGRFECCPDTPYALRSWRRCPYWCDGLSSCRRDLECEALLRERGPRL